MSLLPRMLTALTHWTALLLVLLLGTAGCERVSAALSRAPIPDLGPRIPITVKMELDPSLTNARLQYIDACNAPHEVHLGPQLEAVLLQAAHQTFNRVEFAGPGAGSKSDAVIQVALQQSGLEIKTDNVYDRLPAEMTLEAIATFRDLQGKLIQERPLVASRRERLLLEPTQKRCELASMDAFVHDSAVSLAIQFIREARALLEPAAETGQLPQAPVASPPVAARPAPQAPPSLSFKATLLDDNNNLVLEGGERVRVRVDIVNTATTPASGASARLGGSPGLLSQFPATSMPLGVLQPGETKSVEFIATVPPSLQAQRAELVVSLTDEAGLAVGGAQTLAAAVRQGAAGSSLRAAGKLAPPSSNDVDQVPKGPAGFRQPNTHVIAVGIGAYRNSPNAARKYAAKDAELVAAYLQSLGGVPADNVRVLQDRKAFRPDIEEALLDWLPPRISADSIVIVYFAGEAVVAASGDTYLVPYEGVSGSVTKLYSLKELQSGLAKLRPRLALLIFDGSVSRLGGGGRAGAKGPQWDGGGGNIVRLIGTSGIQPVLEPEQLKHGLYTYYLLRGLRGEADANRDGEVSLRELSTFLTESVPASASNDFNKEQHPLVLPPLSRAGKLAGLTLTKVSRSASDR